MTKLGLVPTPEREFNFRQADFNAIATLVRKEAQIMLPASKEQLVYARLAKRVRATGLVSFSQYVELIGSNAAERACAIDALTTNHTKFYRERHHFDHLAREVWPHLRSRLDGGGRVRMWSAACSSGEEACSIAMAVAGSNASSAAALAKLDFRILATDLSTESLKVAQASIYASQGLEEIPAELRRTWLKPHPQGVEVDPALRELITYRQLNFFGEWPKLQIFDVIFCRNAMIYFDEAAKTELQKRLLSHLAVGGHIYIGHSERIAPSLEDHLQPVGHTGFRRVK